MPQASSPPLMQLVSPFADELWFRSMAAAEELSRPFEFDIEAVSSRPDLDPYAVLGRLVTVSLELPDGTLRFFNGHVTEFGLLGEVGASRFYHYRLVVQPWLWLLTRSSDCRIFQDMSIPDILMEVFNKYPDVLAVDNQLTGTYAAWEYCVQYRETDFNFVSRLMEQEGMHYFFRHEDGVHTLVLADSAAAHEPFGAFGTVPFTQLHSRGLDAETLEQWTISRRIQPGMFSLRDFDFKRPTANLEGKSTQSRDHTGSGGKYFDYPGDYQTADEGRRYSRTRLEELQAQHEQVSAAGSIRSMAVGHLFKLENHPREDQNGKDMLVVSTRLQLRDAAAESEDAGGSHVHCALTAMPGSAPYRPARLTPKPFVQGPQTAIVVGPAGEEIHTDEHGRVKVHFHWDRLGLQDENDSCWIRVSHPWAGKGWGSVSIPRIGQEVIVDFLEGDPDRPIITGRVYNGDSRAAYPLPASAVISGLKSNTHKGKGSNEMSMDDTAGKEKVTIHAQYDMATTVEHDDSQTVHNDRTIKVDGLHTETVTKATKITIESGTYHHDVAGNTATYHVSGDLTENFDSKHTLTVGADQTITLKAKRSTDITADDKLNVGGKRDETVTGNRTTAITGNESLIVTGTLACDATGAASHTSAAKITLMVGASTIELVPASITLSNGPSSIKIDPSGVTITAPKISLNG